MSDLLNELSRKCRHAPKMGGNKEQITVTCGLLSRLIGMTELAEAMTDDARSQENKGQIAQLIKHELAYIDGEVRWMKEIQK